MWKWKEKKKGRLLISLWVFLLFFSLNFLYQRIVDNESTCGGLGVQESHCPYAFLDHIQGYADHEAGEEGEHTEHVCLTCPCNAATFFSDNIYLSKIFARVNTIYLRYFPASQVWEEHPKNLFRPPKFVRSFS